MCVSDNPILTSASAWRYAILEHLVCWVHREHYIARHINDPSKNENFWKIFLYYYNLNRNFKKGDDGSALRQIFAIFECANIPHSDAEFCDGVEDICKSVRQSANPELPARTNAGGPRSAASKVLFNKNSNVGFIFDSRASRSLRSINESVPVSNVSSGFDFFRFKDVYLGFFSNKREEMEAVLGNYASIPGLTAGRVVDKLLYLNGEADIGRWQDVLDASAVLPMLKASDEAATAAGEDISKLFKEKL